ncbi:MAG: RNA polymerase sigma factor RpoH [Alphaproteobacteria bacterium MarineAlpha5_Bin12]|nr:hypothetical protein [Candidatus Neomarinimicrobiota bacterium]PPR41267.1 MAG: RNA polymerase sigma factor RpoH [Alphaproteobacteria bacterium MarineAlpha5_Bin12]|tara:strand:- start:13284 stop:14102 length:819 start_codon:yes stop_codon:yes gene_type:complete
MYNSIAGQLRVPEPLKDELGKKSKEPLLSYQEEIDLFNKYRSYNDKKSYERIFFSHIRLVNKFAKLFAKSNPELFYELQSEGFKGLAIAIKKFDISKSRLCTYASYWILHSIDTFFVQNNFGNIHLGKSFTEKKVFYLLKKSFIEPDKIKEEDLIKIAKENKLSVAKIKDIVALISYNHLNAEDVSVIDDRPNQLDNIITKESFNINLKIFKKRVSELNKRDKRIFEKKHFLNKTYKEIAKEEGISFQRVSQIDNRSIDNLKSQLKNCYEAA